MTDVQIIRQIDRQIEIQIVKISKSEYKRTDAPTKSRKRAISKWEKNILNMQRRFQIFFFTLKREIEDKK